MSNSSKESKTQLGTKPSFYKYTHKKTKETQQFLIFDSPTDDNIQTYLTELKKNKVTAVVRACDPTYDTKPFKDAGIDVVDLPFSDGGPPPEDVLEKWLELLCTQKVKENTVGVHCVAGLGRAPVLVAVAFMEMGMNRFEAIDVIRAGRRGAINSRQLLWIEKYKPKTSQCECLIC